MLTAALLLFQIAAAQGPKPTTVVLFRDTIFTPRAALGPFTAADRAAAAQRRLVEAWEDRTPSDTVGLESRGSDAVLFVGDRAILTVLADDSIAAETVAARLRATWRDGAIPSSWESLLGALLRCALAILLFLVLWRALLSLARRLKGVVLPRVTRWVRDLTVGGVTLLRGAAIRRVAVLVVDLPVWGTVLVLLYATATYTLSQFPATHELGTGLGRSLIETATDMVLRALRVIPDLLAAGLILVGIRFLVRVSDSLFEAVENQTLELPAIHPEVARPTRKLVAILLWLFAIVLIYPLLPGSDSGVFKGISIFVGVLVSLGSTGVVGNAMSGLVIMYSRAFKPGEFIEVEGTSGTVLELGMIATKIRTPKLVEVTIPNSVLVNHGVRNYSRLAADRGVILHTSVTLGYDAPWRSVHRALLAAAAATAGVRDEPAPFILQTALNDHHVTYELNVHVDDPAARPALLAALHASIQDACNAAGIEILSPIFAVRRSGPADTRVPREQWGESDPGPA